jgi:hypothetical protein
MSKGTQLSQATQATQTTQATTLTSTPAITFERHRVKNNRIRVDGVSYPVGAVVALSERDAAYFKKLNLVEPENGERVSHTHHVSDTQTTLEPSEAA